ncbi:MAG: hypothetical protein KDA89_23395, partial [Planctomycetaceae bacterium]|nr:hypothetical protein [Planctomycetaceae bacterium]
YVGGDRQEQPNSIGDNSFGGAVFRGDASITRDPTVVPSPQWDHITHDQVGFDPPGGTASGSSPHADSRELTFDANGDLIETDDGGIFRRTSPRDNTGDWFSLAGRLGMIEYHDIAYDSNTHTLLGGTQDNGTHYQVTANGTVWDFLSGGDGGDVAVDVVSLPGQSFRYSSSQNLGGFRRTTFNAANQQISSVAVGLNVTSGPALVAQFKTPVKLNNVAPERMIIVGANTIYESSDQGDNIIDIGGSLPVSPGNSLQDAVDYGTAGNQDSLYVGLQNVVAVRTSAEGALTVSAAYPGGIVTDVVMNPADFQHAFVTDSNQVFETRDAGATWSEVTGNLMTIAGSALFSVQFVPGAPGAVLVGASLGVFMSQLSSLGNWVEVGDSLPNALAYDLVYDAIDDVLVVGTMGRGSWKYPDASVNLFASSASNDFGDAPTAAQAGGGSFVSDYPVTAAEDGARHTPAGPTLGTNRDGEVDGVHSAGAVADDTIGSPDDEDGVTFTASIIASTKTSRIGSVTVDLQNADGTSNRLDAWIDFNRDGDWNDPGEHILTNYDLGTTNGLRSVNFAIPQDSGSNVQEGTTFARFRLSTAGSLSVTGAAADGEVEDHIVTIGPSTDAILLEPFDHSGQFSVSEPFFSIGDGSAFFGISDGAGGGDFGPGSPPAPTVPSYTGATGNFLTGMDMDASATGHTAASLPIIATWTGLNISGQSGLQFGADFASFDEGVGGDPGRHIEPSDFIKVEVQIDGGGFVNIMEFRGNNTGGANAAQFSLDTDGNGSGDGTLLTDALRNFTADILGTGNLLDVRISLSVSDQDEDFAVDNVTITANNATGPFVVDTIADESDGDYSAGDFSLREAIERANTRVGADEIQFAAGLSGQTITLTIDQLSVTDDLTITGLGASNLTVSGGNSFRVFDLQHDADVVIDGLKITAGRTTLTSGPNTGISGGGAGIRSSGTLQLSNSVVTGNHTTATAADGGGIYQVTGMLTLIN